VTGKPQSYTNGLLLNDRIEHIRRRHGLKVPKRQNAIGYWLNDGLVGAVERYLRPSTVSGSLPLAAVR